MKLRKIDVHLLQLKHKFYMQNNDLIEIENDYSTKKKTISWLVHTIYNYQD